MRRLSIFVFALVLALAAIAPAGAAGATKYRYWQDLDVSGPFSGRISLAIAYEDRNGNGRFTPRYAAAYRLRVQTSCDAGPREVKGNAFSKYGYFKAPLTNGLFTHRFENQFEQPQQAPLRGELKGRVEKKLTKGGRVVRAARVSGAFDLQDWTLEPGVDPCVSSASYAATQCKRWRAKRDRPRWYREWKAPPAAEPAPPAACGRTGPAPGHASLRQRAWRGR